MSPRARGVGGAEVGPRLGSLPVTLTSVWFEDVTGTGELALAVGVPADTVVAPGGSVPVTVVYAPVAESASSGLLHVESTDTSNPSLTTTVTGSAHYGAAQVDEFSYLGAVDILWVIDNSCSMTEEQLWLAGDASGFIDALDAGWVDYHLGVVTTDDGALRGLEPIITSSLSDPAGELAANIQAGVSGSGIEQGFTFGYAALIPPIAITDNYGFLRSDAALRVVFVSDEQEQSGGPVADWVLSFQALKSDPALVSLSGITGGAEGCTGPGGSASAGTRYQEAAALTGGLDLSICSGDWSNNVSEIANWATVGSPPEAIALSTQPVVDTIDVEVDGVPVESGWAYDLPSNSIELSSLVLLPGEVLTVSYAISGGWCLPNTAPNAALVQTLAGGTCEQILVDGSGSSDPDGDALAGWSWTLEGQPAGSALTADSILALAPGLVSLYPDVPGLWTFGLSVRDEFGASSGLETLEVSVASGGNPDNLGPEAVIASGDDDDSAPDDDDSAPDDDDDSAPVIAGADRLLVASAACTYDACGGANCSPCFFPELVLDGSGSFDPDGEDISYGWALLSPSAPMTLASAVGPVTSLFLNGGIAASAAGIYSEETEVELTVVDCNGEAASTSIYVTWQCVVP